jgi:hypothetical protein
VCQDYDQFKPIAYLGEDAAYYRDYGVIKGGLPPRVPT